ncbi:hypothetical protein EJB05_05799, partial [Eragrostis curvula]
MARSRFVFCFSQVVVAVMAVVLVGLLTGGAAHLQRVLPFLGSGQSPSADPRRKGLFAWPSEAHSRSTARSLLSTSTVGASSEATAGRTAGLLINLHCEAHAHLRRSGLTTPFCTHCLVPSVGGGTIVGGSAAQDLDALRLDFLKGWI